MASILQLTSFIGILLLMLAAETFWPKRVWLAPRSKRIFFHGALATINSLWTRLLVVGPVLYWVGFVSEKSWGLSRILGLSGISEVILTILFFDHINYWWHRCNHRLGFLWRFHKAHHLDIEVDTTTALRFHPGELFISYLFKSIWIFVWGPSILGYVLFESLITAFSQFHHTNIDFPDKVEKILRLIHITPRLHASHHTVSMRTRDANFSTILSVWDRLFGSFKEPNYKEIENLGLEEGRESPLSFQAFLKAPFTRAA